MRHFPTCAITGRTVFLGLKPLWPYGAVWVRLPPRALETLAAGVHPKVVSDRLGDSTIAITIDTYSHVIPSLDAYAAATVAGPR